MVALWLLALQTPSLPPNFPTDVDLLREVVCYKDKAYLLRAPVHVASSVSHVFQHEGTLVFERNEPIISLQNPNPRRSGVYRIHPGADKPVPLMEFSERRLFVGGIAAGRLFAYTVQGRVGQDGKPTPVVSLVRYSIKDRKVDTLEVPIPTSQVFIQGNSFSPYLSLTVGNRSFLTRVDGGGWLAEGEQFSLSKDGRVFRLTLTRETLSYEEFDPSTRSFSPKNEYSPEWEGAWNFGASRRLEPEGYVQEAPGELLQKQSPEDFPWTVSRESQSSGRTPAKFNRNEAWLVTKDPEGPNRAPISWDTKMIFAFDNRSISYVEKGHLYYRPIYTMDRKQFEEAVSVAESTELMQQAKDVAIGIILFSADNDDNFPPTTGWQDAVLPYLKNRDLLNGFEFTPPAGITNTTKMDDPANTPIGKIRGRFGTAIARGDGSIRWVKNP